MLKRFVAASAVAGVVIACAAVGLAGLARVYQLQHPLTLTLIWCMVPAIWGVWAMLTPTPWMPARLPEWGAVLGLVVAIGALFVLNIPMRMTDVYLRMRWRGVGVLVGVAIYYLLWIAVRVVYQRLTTPAEVKTFKAAA
jgi:hypothetical protein